MSRVRRRAQAGGAVHPRRGIGNRLDQVPHRFTTARCRPGAVVGGPGANPAFHAGQPAVRSRDIPRRPQPGGEAPLAGIAGWRAPSLAIKSLQGGVQVNGQGPVAGSWTQRAFYRRRLDLPHPDLNRQVPAREWCSCVADQAVVVKDDFGFVHGPAG